MAYSNKRKTSYKIMNKVKYFEKIGQQYEYDEEFDWNEIHGIETYLDDERKYVGEYAKD